MGRYHEFIAASLAAFGGKACQDTMRRGIAQIATLSTSEAGRKKVAETFQLCGTNPLPDGDAAFALQMDQMGNFQGFVQVNNQPSLLGQVDLACRVAADALESGASDLEALAAVNIYFSHNGNASWCYGFNYSSNVWIPDSNDAYNSYSYQCCTQGTVMSSLLPAEGTDNTLSPRYEVHREVVERDCKNVFGKEIPRMKAPWFLKNIRSLLLVHGGVVFTNGDLDGWAGGSAMSYRDMWDLNDAQTAQSIHKRAAWGFDHLAHGAQTAISFSRKLLSREMWHFPGISTDLGIARMNSLQKPGQLAFVTYTNASHCTDTHTNTWNSPGQRLKWRQQRAEAMDYAVAFAAPFRAGCLAAASCLRATFTV